MVFVISGLAIVGAIGAGVRFLHHHGVFEKVFHLFSRKVTFGSIWKKFTVDRMVKQLRKDLKQLCTLLVTIAIAVISSLGSTWQYYGYTGIISDASEAWCYTLTNQTDWVVNRMSANIKYWEDHNDGIFYQERIRKGLIDTRQQMISQFVGSLPNQTYIHRMVEIELIKQIYNLWDEPDVFGMLVYGHKRSGKTTTLVDILLHISLSYDVFVINPRYYWFVAALDWTLWIATFGQIRIDFYYEYIQTRSDYAGLFKETYPSTLHKDLKNVYTDNKHKFHVAFVSKIDLLKDKPGEEQIRDALLYDAGKSDAGLAIVTAARSLKYPLLLWIHVNRCDAKSHAELVKFARGLKQMYSDIRVLIETSTMVAHGSSEEAENRFVHFYFPLLNEDEISPFVDAAGGKVEKFENEDAILRITSGKPKEVIQLVASDTAENYLNLYRKKKDKLIQFNNFDFLKDECKYENHNDIQSFYLDWSFDSNGQINNKTKNETVATLVKKKMIDWHDDYKKYIFVDSAVGYMICEED